MKESTLLQQARIERKRRDSEKWKPDISKLSRSEMIQKLHPNYVIQDKPRLFHDSTKPDKYVIGAYGSGKTTTFCAEGSFLGWINRPLNVLLIIQTQSNSNLTTTDSLIKLYKDNAIEYEYRDIKGIIYFDVAWGSKEEDIAHFLIASGYNPDSIAGPTVSAVGIDECFLIKQKTRDVAVARARDPRAKINEVFFASTINPYDQDWGHEICENDYKGDDNTFKITMTAYDNKFAPKEFLDRMERTYPDDMKRVFIYGENVSLKGKAVYRYKDQTKKLHEDLVIPKNQIIQLLFGFDFNVGMMCAGEIWLDGRIRRQIDEYKIEDSNTEELCDLMINRLLEKYPGINGVNSHMFSLNVFMDAAAKQRKSSAKLGVTDGYIVRDAFRNNNFNAHIHIPNENPPVRDRVQFSNNLLDKEEFVIYDNCKHSIMCRKFTKWKEGADGFSIVTSGKWSHMSAANDYALWWSQRMIPSEHEQDENENKKSRIIMLDEREFK